MSDTNPANVWVALGLTAPPSLSKKQVAINNRHNRTIRLNVIKGIIRSFGKLNALDQARCGLIKVELDKKHYYFGVELSPSNQIRVIPVKEYPTGAMEGFLEYYWSQINSRAVGVVVSHNKVLPILNDGVSLIVGKWKND